MITNKQTNKQTIYIKYIIYDRKRGRPKSFGLGKKRKADTDYLINPYIVKARKRLKKIRPYKRII